MTQTDKTNKKCKLGFQAPSIKDIESIAKQFSNDDPFVIDRFSTGLCHYVYDVKGSNERFVIRVCHPDNLDYLKGHLFWSEELKDKNLPVVKTFASSIGKEKYDYVILEYIDGVDLGNVIDQMDTNHKQAIVLKLIKFNKTAGNLPEAEGYGWGFNYNCHHLQSSWTQIINSSLERAREWIRSVGKVELSYVERVEKVSQQFHSYFEKIKPIAFFHDLTTKNLLISPANYSIIGFVDIDEMAFGDKLFHLSLMNMALLGNDQKNDLVEMWLDALEATETERRVLDLYTLIHCVTFMGENGKSFNKESVFNEEYHLKLQKIYDGLFNKF